MISIGNFCSPQNKKLSSKSKAVDLIGSICLLELLPGLLQSVSVGILLQNESITSLGLLESDSYEQGLGAQEWLDLGLEGLVLHIDGAELLLVRLVDNVADVGQQDLEALLSISTGSVRRNLLDVLVDLLGVGLELLGRSRRRTIPGTTDVVLDGSDWLSVG